jgi:hypothetical protein
VALAAYIERDPQRSGLGSGAPGRDIEDTFIVRTQDSFPSRARGLVALGIQGCDSEDVRVGPAIRGRSASSHGANHHADVRSDRVYPNKPDPNRTSRQ